MSFNLVSPGKDIPNDFNVIIEISAQSDPVKYEADKETGLLFVDRFIGTGMRYPANYGFIPQTLSATATLSTCWCSRRSRSWPVQWCAAARWACSR